MSNEAFKDIYGGLPNVLKLKVLSMARNEGAYKASKHFEKETGMSWNGLYRRLQKELERNAKKMPVAESSRLPGQADYTPFQKGQRQAANARKKETEVKLSKDEKKLIRDLKDGKASLEDASRLVAVKVFEKMFKNPDNVKFLDFFRVELLKIKKMEAETKKTWAMQLVSRMFGGAELPPPVCPKCNHELVPGGATVLEGEIIGDVESLPITGNS